MSVPPLLELMTRQAAQEREALLAGARQEAAGLEESARTRAQQRSEATLQAVDAEIGEASRRAKERAEAAAQMVLLTTKDTVADEVLAQVAQALDRVASGPEFGPVLESLLAELIASAPAGTPLVVLAPPAHAERCKAWLGANGHGDITVESSASLRDGVAVQDPERTFRVTNTLSMRFGKREAALRKQCLQRLFGG